jgi:hypothetical protein
LTRESLIVPAFPREGRQHRVRGTASDEFGTVIGSRGSAAAAWRCLRKLESKGTRR